MRRFAVLAVLALALAAPAGVSASEHGQFVGVKGCLTCHGNSPRDHYHDWLTSRHARAYEALKGREKLDPACLSCHATGQGGSLAPGVAAADLRGVQCEACHGPGSLYRALGVMKDKKAAVARGLVLPTRDTCLRCHR